VLGVVVMPGLLLGGRAGKAKSSVEGSWMVGGKEAPPASGEGWVAERWPGEGAAAVSVNEAEACRVCAGRGRTWIRERAVGHDLQTG
jgi:hypothetical protein